MNKITRNYFFNLIYQVISICVPLITAPYLSRILGADQIGRYSFVQSIVAYFVLISALGTALYGQRYIAGKMAKNQDIKTPFFEIFIVRVIGVTIGLAIYFFFVYRNANDKLLYMLAVIELIAVAFDISWFYQGIEQFNVLAMVNGIAKIIGTIFIFVSVNSKNDLNIYVACYCGSILLGNILQWLFLKKYLKGKASKKIHILKHIIASSALLISQIAIQLYTVLDKTMIGIITKDDYQNGFYEQSQKLIKTLVAIITAMVAVMASRIAIIWNEQKKGYKEKISELMLMSFRVVFALAFPIMIGTIIVSDRIVPIYYGDGYEPVINMLKMLAIIIPIIGCSNVIGLQLFVPSNRENLLTKSVIVGSIINVIANTILISNYGANGAVIASILAETVVTIMQFILARKELPNKQIFYAALRYLGYSLIMGIFGKLLSINLDDGVFSLIIIVVVCIFVYCILLIVFRDPILGVIKKDRDY